MQFEKGKMILKTVLLIFFLGWSAACGRDKETLITTEVGKLVEDFSKDKRTECRETLLRDAERLVDSILLAEAKTAMTDSLSLNKPHKPLKPVPIPPLDSAKVKQLF